MEKTIIRPKSPLLIVVYLIGAIFTSAPIIVVAAIISEGGVSWLSIFALISSVALSIGGILWIRLFATKKFVIDEESISVEKDKGGKLFPVLQYAVKVAFKDISDLFLIISSKASNNRSVAGVFTPMLYLVIENKKGKQKLFNLYYYSKNQRNALLDIILSKAHAVGNLTKYNSVEEIWKDSGM